MTDENFRVVLCRAKERFRAIYLEQTKHRGPSRHSDGMSMDFHGDPVQRERSLRGICSIDLNAEQAEEWESHYLGCNDCFEEIRATEFLIRGLGEPIVERKRVNDVTVLNFARGTELLAASLELTELSKAIRLESDTKVLIDLSRVSRIDSTGLGVLMNCYCHAVKNAGVAEAAETRMRPCGAC